MTQSSIKLFRLLISCALSIFILTACNYRETANVKDDVLVYCSEGSPESFNPQLSTSGTTFDASSRTLYNRLVEFKLGTTLIEPALAERWEVSKNGHEYIFYLRQDVEFHANKYFNPTRKFNALDVLFSFERQWLEQHPYHAVSNLSFGYFKAMNLSQLIEDIDVIDDHTIRFKLSRADSAFLATLAMDFASILSAEYSEHLSKNDTPELIDTQPVGTGPFQLVRYQPDAFIRFKAHPKYWAGKQKLKNLVYAITPDPSLRFARTIAGECDVMANPLPVQIDVAASQDNMLVLNQPGLNVSFLTMNTLKPPFNNLAVRMALNHAINKTSIIKAVYQNKATTAKSPIPPSMWAYDKTLIEPDYNPEKARELLNLAGYAEGFDMNIWTMSAQRAYNPNAKKMAELIQQDLKAVGIRAEIATYEYGTFLRKTRRGEHHTALMGWISDNGDPDNFFSPLLSCAATISGTNSARWCDGEFNQLIDKARTKGRVNYRKSLYAQAQQVFMDASPWVPIAHATQHIIINPRVKNFKVIPAGGVYFNDVYLAKTVKNELQSD